MANVLCNRLDTIREHARQYTRINRIAEDRSQYEQIRDVIVPLAARYHHLITLRRTLASKGVMVDPLEPRGDGAGTSVTALRKAFQEDPASLVQSSSHVARGRKKLFAQLESILERWDSQLRTIWERHLHNFIAHLEPDLLQVLRGVPAFRHNVDSIRRDQDEIRRLASRLPQDAAELTSVEQLASRINDAWGSLTGGGIHPDVVGFLKAAGRGGASLQSVTEPVQTWLQEHDLVNVFVVSIRSRS